MSGEALARTLCLRQPGSAYRFVLRDNPAPELQLTAMREARPAAPGYPGDVTGVVITDENYRLLFYAPTNPRALLQRLAVWARDAIVDLPAAAALIGAGAARWERQDEPPPPALRVCRDDRVWTGLAIPGPAQVASVLARAAAGERLWYWLAEAPGALGAPLLLQSVERDPNRDFMNALIDFAERGDPGPAQTGIAHTTVDGALQFLGRKLSSDHLVTLSRWVHASLTDFPDLARLVGARLLCIDGGRVAAVVDDPACWRGIARPPV